MKAMLALLITFIPCAIYANELFTMIAKRLLAKLPAGTTLIATSVVSPFMTPFKVAFFVGMFLSMSKSSPAADCPHRLLCYNYGKSLVSGRSIVILATRILFSDRRQHRAPERH